MNWTEMIFVAGTQPSLLGDRTCQILRNIPPSWYSVASMEGFAQLRGWIIFDCPGATTNIRKGTEYVAM